MIGLRVSAVLAVFLAIGCTGRGSSTGHGMTSRAVTLEGEIIDPQCYFTHGGGQGLAHRPCALFCARGGQNMAFLNRAGSRVYPIIAAKHGADPNDGLLGYVGYPVVIEGTWFGSKDQRVLRIDAVKRLDGGAPVAPESVLVDPIPHTGADSSARDTTRRP